LQGWPNDRERRFTFAPATTVGSTDGDFSKAISFLWKRQDRHLLGVLHSSLCKAVEEWSLFQLHRLSVLAWAYDGGFLKALCLLGVGARETGDTFPFDEGTLHAVRSFAPTRWPNRYLVQQAKTAWSKWPSEG